MSERSSPGTRPRIVYPFATGCVIAFIVCVLVGVIPLGCSPGRRKPYQLWQPDARPQEFPAGAGEVLPCRPTGDALYLLFLRERIAIRPNEILQVFLVPMGPNCRCWIKRWAEVKREGRRWEGCGRSAEPVARTEMAVVRHTKDSRDYLVEIGYEGSDPFAVAYKVWAAPVLEEPRKVDDRASLERATQVVLQCLKEQLDDAKNSAELESDSKFQEFRQRSERLQRELPEFLAHRRVVCALLVAKARTVQRDLDPRVPPAELVPADASFSEALAQLRALLQKQESRVKTLLSETREFAAETQKYARYVDAATQVDVRSGDITWSAWARQELGKPDPAGAVLADADARTLLGDGSCETVAEASRRQALVARWSKLVVQGSKRRGAEVARANGLQQSLRQCTGQDPCQDDKQSHERMTLREIGEHVATLEARAAQEHQKLVARYEALRLEFAKLGMPGVLAEVPKALDPALDKALETVATVESRKAECLQLVTAFANVKQALAPLRARATASCKAGGTRESEILKSALAELLDEAGPWLEAVDAFPAQLRRLKAFPKGQEIVTLLAELLQHQRSATRVLERTVANEQSGVNCHFEHAQCVYASPGRAIKLVGEVSYPDPQAADSKAWPADERDYWRICLAPGQGQASPATFHLLCRPSQGLEVALVRKRAAGGVEVVSELGPGGEQKELQVTPAGVWVRICARKGKRVPYEIVVGQGAASEPLVVRERARGALLEVELDSAPTRLY